MFLTGPLGVVIQSIVKGGGSAPFRLRLTSSEVIFFIENVKNTVAQKNGMAIEVTFSIIH